MSERPLSLSVIDPDTCRGQVCKVSTWLGFPKPTEVGPCAQSKGTTAPQLLWKYCYIEIQAPCMPGLSNFHEKLQIL